MKFAEKISILALLALSFSISFAATPPALAEKAVKVAKTQHVNLAKKPWKDKNRAIILDAYEKNKIDWLQVVENKQIRAFIGKASDGMPSPYACPTNKTSRILCKKTYQNYFMKQQLYHTRKVLAKGLGLKWGAYHLGRPGNPVAQANHFLAFAKPEPDELIAIDIEHDDPKKWISFKDAEIFAKHIHKKLGRYPALYTNHDTAKKIAARRAEFPILSRLPLWYARFRADITGAFPMGNWESYAFWQFSAGVNCSKRNCLYRVNGTPTDIDVNVSPLTIAEFDKAWPFAELVPEKLEDNQDNLVYAADTSEDEKPLLQLASLEATDDRIDTSKHEPVTDRELDKMGVEEIAIPVRAPREGVQVADAVNLVVRIKKSRLAKSTAKLEPIKVAATCELPHNSEVASLYEINEIMVD